MNTPTTLMAVVTTVGTPEQARELARKMVQERLAACAQISEMESVYEWKGRLEQEREWRIVFKTTANASTALQKALAEAHPYEVPAILTLQVDEANAAYALWVGQQTQS